LVPDYSETELARIGLPVIFEPPYLGIFVGMEVEDDFPAEKH
jgi:hypothetical protein